MKKNLAFSLIELMIVVAIIGILAAIAIPQYQKYTARSQAAEAISLVSPAKTALSEIYQRSGDVSNVATTSEAGLSTTTGKYIGSLTVSAVSSTEVTFTVTFNSSAASDLSGQTMEIGVNASTGLLTCYPGTIDTDLLPSGCSSAPPTFEPVVVS